MTVTEAVLTLLLLVQQGIWTYYTSKLINKVMSGNYTTYLQNQHYDKNLKNQSKAKQEIALKLEDPRESIEDDLNVLNKLIRPF